MDTQPTKAVCSGREDLPKNTEFLLLEEGVSAVGEVKTRVAMCHGL